MTDRDRARLAAILGMLGSEFEGEQASAARQAEAFRKRHGLTWEQMLATPPPEIVEVVRPAPPEPPPPPSPPPKPQAPPLHARPKFWGDFYRPEQALPALYAVALMIGWVWVGSYF